MKFKLFNLIAVCLVTSGLLALPLAAFGNSAEEPNNPEQTQQKLCVKQGELLLCNVEKSRQRDRESVKTQVTINKPQAPDSLQSSKINVVPELLSPAQQDSIANIVLWIGYLIPCCTFLGIFLYDQYCDYHSAKLNGQIEMLERLWQKTSQH
jgi:hypothetical protein